MAHLYIAAPQKSSGKTTLSIGICRELRRRGLVVQPFKKGPDYIDPLWLSQAANRSCFNLDFHTMAPEEISDAFARELSGADVGVIEGNVGLFDSTDIRGANSNAELAKQLRAPVVLVVNCNGLARGIAPLLLGYLAFDPELEIAGVILNKVGGMRHGENLVRVVEHYTDVAVLGVLRREDDLAISERHLGLMPINEAKDAEAWIESIRGRVAEEMDFDRLIEIAERAPGSEPRSLPSGASPSAGSTLRLGIARDSAFGFYYPDDLRALAMGGAELVPFSPISDAELPPVDALFIGGGFPEYRMAELEANVSMRQSIADFIAQGGPTYAECGGLMYLCKGLSWQGRRCQMAGALEAEVEMRQRPQGRGYVRLRETQAFPWPRAALGGKEIPAHEFHHSAIVAPNPTWRYGYEVVRGTGIDGSRDGVVQGNLLACYSHLRAVSDNRWTERFLGHVRRCLGG
ncbi:cobyrinate a,c-diamide synthase [Thiorhodococcus mannitoliphagus]|uniref:Cobyrinate a,c-diamide synthase n=1 Tax=Thiorhodococcus mannitoliphagus TaxID=329406 RepID=A0A6P1DXX2_9GAMM|nr:cobyrinate a,c-diamide synthase [Thiorhodococcus mannitoliphagus]NEX20564.1 cobyrinate a,c-diamide synthase [Thiorhodococcus mannitoliphagus]